MAWHDEYPNKLYASVLLLDNKIVNWKVGQYAKKVYDWTFRWDMSRLKDYGAASKEFTVNNDEERCTVFEELAPEFFKQWELADDYVGFKPY